MPEAMVLRTGSRTAAALALALLGALAPACDAQAQVYVGAAPVEGGGVVLSNFQSEHTPTLLLAAPAADPAPAAASASAPPAPAAALSKSALGELVREAAAQAGVSPMLVHAVIAAESNFDAAAVSRKGAVGLMQLMPNTARLLGVANRYDPRENVFGGARYLRWLADRLDDRVDLVLAAYNAGLNNVTRAGYRVPAFPETRDYVRSVLSRVRCSRPSTCEAAAGRTV